MSLIILTRGLLQSSRPSKENSQKYLMSSYLLRFGENGWGLKQFSTPPGCTCTLLNAFNRIQKALNVRFELYLAVISSAHPQLRIEPGQLEYDANITTTPTGLGDEEETILTLYSAALTFRRVTSKYTFPIKLCPRSGFDSEDRI